VIKGVASATMLTVAGYELLYKPSYDDILLLLAGVTSGAVSYVAWRAADILDYRRRSR
jgi:hypothetical protein